METNEYGQTWQQAWDLYFVNHPEVLASWGHQNGRWMNCPCAQCDPGEIRPRPDFLTE
jgi:hypothetical protein